MRDNRGRQTVRACKGAIDAYQLLLAAAAALLVTAAPASAQSVKHIQSATPGGIANGVWVGDTLYLSGQLPNPTRPAEEPNTVAAAKAVAVSAATSQASGRCRAMA